MSKAKMYTSSSKIPTYPGLNHSLPSGAAPIGASHSPKSLAWAIRYGNRQTRRLAQQTLRSSHHRKLMKICGDL